MSEAAAAGSGGPLAGVTVIEMAGLGPAPLAALMLAEMGARVLRVERPNGQALLSLPPDLDYTRHGRHCIRIDLKNPEGRALLLDLAAKADVLIEGFRPGVMEKLALGPDTMLERNPRLIYGRITGFGQTGPLAERAGHDLTYLAYSGVLHAIGPAEKPIPPLNLVADFGGGAMFLIAGLLAALVERATSGKGQVVDAAMIDGALGLALPFFPFIAAGHWVDRRQSNLLDGGAPFYDTYATADGRHVAVACLEPQFFAEFARLLPLDGRYVASQYDKACWGDMRRDIAARLMEKSRDDWQALFENTDACVAPVLNFEEAQRHPHNVARATHVGAGRLARPAPAPRLSRTGLTPRTNPASTNAAEALAAFGIADAAALFASGAVSSIDGPES